MFSEMSMLDRNDHVVSAFPPHQQSALDPITILLVEDVTSDAYLTRRALIATQIPCSLSLLQKGSEVVPYLLDSRRRDKSLLPDLILLDLGLPGADGFEILEELSRAPSAIRAVPIVVLTGHRYFDYLQHDYGICEYLSKPCDPARLREILQKLGRSRYRS